MTEINRTTLLDYLNDNKIDYNIDPTDQTIECSYWWNGKVKIEIDNYYM